MCKRSLPRVFRKRRRWAPRQLSRWWIALATFLLCTGWQPIAGCRNRHRVSPTVTTGLEGVLPAGSNGDALAAIAGCNRRLPFQRGQRISTRTANQIVQEHFNPGEFNQPSGPCLECTSQLACSDFTLASSERDLCGPQRSPLGLSADPCFPLQSRHASWWCGCDCGWSIQHR